MQSLAYDPDEGEVPEEMRTLRLNQTELRKLCDFKWEQLDVLNHIILKLRGEAAGTTFRHHNTKLMYHDGDMIGHVIDLVGKLFECIGFPTEVDEEEGLTFRGFMARIRRLQVHALALTDDEQRNAYAVIDDFVQRGYAAAAQAAKRVIFGPNPADRELKAWLDAHESVVMELKATLKAIGQVATHRRVTSGIFAKPTKAASLHHLSPSWSLRQRVRTSDRSRRPPMSPILSPMSPMSPLITILIT